MNIVFDCNTTEDYIQLENLLDPIDTCLRMLEQIDGAEYEKQNLNKLKCLMLKARNHYFKDTKQGKIDLKRMDELKLSV